MPFEPFGFRFEIVCPMAPSKVKEAIRSKRKGWFDPKQGARGWIAGPFLCLWLSAFDRYGPMLVGRITTNGFGTRVSGRAGSDLNGLLFMALLIPLLVWFGLELVLEGQGWSQTLTILAVIILLSPLFFWVSHKDRKQAEPLVRFLRDTLNPARRSLQAQLNGVKFSPNITMDFSGERRECPLTPEGLFDALQASMPEDFIILSTSEEEYIQTLACDGGFVLEKREGSSGQHFKATAPDKQVDETGRAIFTFDETLAALVAYASATPFPAVIRWKHVELTE